MKKPDAQMKIRLPAHLKEEIEASALARGISMNAEIVSRLERETHTNASLYEFLKEEAKDLEDRVRSLREESERHETALERCTKEGDRAEVVTIIVLEARRVAHALLEARRRLRRIKAILNAQPAVRPATFT